MTEANGDQPQGDKKNGPKQTIKGRVSSGTMDQYMIPVTETNFDTNGEEKSTKGRNSTNSELNEHWQTVKDGPSGKIVKIKKEIVENHHNTYEKLGEETEEKDDNNMDDDSDVGDIYGVENNEDEVDITMFARIAKETIEDLQHKDLDKLTIADISEAVFTIKRCENHKLTRSQIYLKEEKWLKQQITNGIKTYKEKEFIVKVDQLAKKIKITDFDDPENEEMLQELVTELHDISEQKSAVMNMEENKKALLDVREVIKLIEEYAKDPLIMVPKEMLRLETCEKEEIKGTNYYQLALAVMYTQGKFENVLTKTRKQLVQRAEEIWRDQQLKTKSNANIGSPSKKSKNNVSVVTPSRPGSSIQVPQK